MQQADSADAIMLQQLNGRLENAGPKNN